MSGPAAGLSDTAFEVTLPPRPYPGLRPFEKHEWPIFFGRERMADAVVSAIVEKRVLVVHGDSGCGKSSLVRAAVLPRLEQENARGGIQWRTCATSPGESPLWNLARDLAAEVAGQADDELAFAIRRALNFGAEAPAEVAALIGARADRQWCVLIDQFEELFEHARRYGPDEATVLTGFCTALFRNPPDGLNAILTMRSEFLGACARFDDFALTVNATQYLLPRMHHEDLVRAIQEPATLYDGTVTRALAERLIADAGGGQDELPLIQHGLMLLHRDRREPSGPWRLGVEEYTRGRGLKALLSDHADAVLAYLTRRLPAEAARLPEDLFRALTDINADGQAIRRPRTLSQLTEASGADTAHVRQVVDAFRAEGVSFLRPYGAGPLDDDARIDISHEALIRRWTAIADPTDGWLVREFRNGLVWRALLVQADSFDRNTTNVLSPTTTDEREAWLTRRTSAWAERYGGGWDRVQHLVAASVVARDRQRADEAAARQRDANDRLRQQRYRLLLRGSTALLVLFVAAVYFWLQSTWETDRANRALADARVEFDRANMNLARSEALAAEARTSAAALQQVIDQLKAAPPSGQTAPRAQAQAQALRDLSAVAAKLSRTETSAAVAPATGARVYLHITDESVRGRAQAFRSALERLEMGGSPLVVPDIELVKSAPPASVLRCFQDDECGREAVQILEASNRLLGTPTLELQNLSARYGDSKSIRPRHYEIWFTGDVRLRAAATR